MVKRYWPKKGWFMNPARHALAAKGVKTRAIEAKKKPKRVIKIGSSSNAPGQVLAEMEFEYELLEDVMQEYQDDANYYLSVLAEGAKQRGDPKLAESIEKGISAISEEYSRESGAIRERLDDFLTYQKHVPPGIWDRANTLKMRIDLASEEMGWFPPESHIKGEERQKVIRQIKGFYPKWKIW